MLLKLPLSAAALQSRQDIMQRLLCISVSSQVATAKSLTRWLQAMYILIFLEAGSLRPRCHQDCCVIKWPFLCSKLQRTSKPLLGSGLLIRTQSDWIRSNSFIWTLFISLKALSPNTVTFWGTKGWGGFNLWILEGHSLARNSHQWLNQSHLLFSGNEKFKRKLIRAGNATQGIQKLGISVSRPASQSVRFSRSKPQGRGYRCPGRQRKSLEEEACPSLLWTRWAIPGAGEAKEGSTFK